MDSRIREIEQWVAEAREGLSDGGREAYLCKLYLLEAEIRAVIKENGMLPQGVSPRPVEKRVRRSASPALAFNMSVALAGVCVLAATTFYFVRNAETRPNRYLTMQPRLASVSNPAASKSIPPTRKALAAILAERGEELLPDSWAPETESSFVGDPGAGATLLASSNTSKTAKQAGAVPAKSVSAAKPAGTLILAAKPASKPAAPGLKPGANQPAAVRKAGDDGSATDVVLLADLPASGAAHESKLKTGSGAGSMPSSGFNDRAILSNLQVSPDGLYPPKPQLKNATKAKMSSKARDKHTTEGKVEDVVVDSESGDDADEASSDAGSAGSADKAVDKSGDDESQSKGQADEKS